MSPDKKPLPRSRSKRPTPTKTKPSPDDGWDIVFFRRHPADDPVETMPGREWLSSCPTGVRADIGATLTQVASAPPHKFAGGGRWEAMSGSAKGCHEIRVDGPNRHHYRLFCLLDRDAVHENGSPCGPLLVVLDGAVKPFRTKLAEGVYEALGELRNEYRARNPRSVG